MSYAREDQRVVNEVYSIRSPYDMASQQSVDIQVISDILALTYVAVATLALFAYDTLLTLLSEITYIWHRRVRLGTVLYLLARYPVLLMFIIGVYVDIANITLEVSIEGNYMLHNQGMRWVLGALGLLLYMGNLGTVVFIAVKDTCNITAQDMDVLMFCSLTDHLSLADTISNVLNILFDTLVVVVTLYNTLGLMRHSREFKMLVRKSLAQTLAEQGLIRYGSNTDSDLY
ncbi:hypothetical protein JB92DRAFT_2826313 [Gautieria morchelliformis]|nr:hypothetical protein JB92DRAFT_2826313 [Gautieria morchelliformis]